VAADIETLLAEAPWLALLARSLTRNAAEVDGLSVVDLGSGETMLVITQRPADALAKLTILRGAERRTVAVAVRDAH
jgi:hypothetical protein